MATLNFPYYTLRWGRKENLSLTKTETGWHLQKIAHSGACEPDGSPLLVANFRQDLVSYPSEIGSFLEHLWRQLDRGEIDHDRAQERLNELGAWVASCEQSTPKWPGWN